MDGPAEGCASTVHTSSPPSPFLPCGVMYDWQLISGTGTLCTRTEISLQRLQLGLYQSREWVTQSDP